MAIAKKSRKTMHENEVAQLLDKDIFTIDPNRLDDEWLAQPKLFGLYAEKLANARYDHELAKARLDVVIAETNMTVRDDPEKFGMEKATEAGINAAVMLTKEVKMAHVGLTDKKHLVELLQAAVNALDHRKRALENLVTLWGQDYFSKPRAKGVAGAAALDEVAASSTARTAKKHRSMRDK